MNGLRLLLAINATVLLALESESPARPRSTQPSVASIEVEIPESGATAQTPVDDGPRAQTGEPPGAGNPLWAIPMEKLSATRDRPLFSASRRPATPVVAAAPAPLATEPVKPVAPEAPPFTLVGTIIGDNHRIAIFLNDATKATTWVQEGQSESGWILRYVDPRSTVLEGSGRTVTLDLPEPSAKGVRAPRTSGIIRRRNSANDSGDF